MFAFLRVVKLLFSELIRKRGWAALSRSHSKYPAYRREPIFIVADEAAAWHSMRLNTMAIKLEKVSMSCFY